MNLSIIFLLFVINISNRTVFVLGDDHVYQPTKQEIERFQVIQEQIRHHQQEEQRERERKKKLAHEEMQRQRQENLLIEPRHPAESLLIPHSALVPMFVHKQQQHSDHRVPMPPLLPEAASPIGFGPAPMNLHHPSSYQYHQQPAVVQEMNMNNPYIGEKMRQMNLHVNVGHSINNNKFQRNHHRDDQEDVDKHHMDSELNEGSRLDKNRPGEETNRYGHPYRCYSCHWNIALCSDFNCYNNPDICTNNNFAPHMVQQADCPGGCEQFVITDPNGLTQQWKRGCAQPVSLPIKRMRCQTYYEFGVRIDRCVCNTDWCNGSHLINGVSSKLSILITIVSIINLIY